MGAYKNIDIDCQNAVGCEFTVRTSKTSTTTGVITKVEWAGWKTNRNNTGKFGTYNVFMECGVDKVNREFRVRRIPKS